MVKTTNSISIDDLPFEFSAIFLEINQKKSCNNH